MMVNYFFYKLWLRSVTEWIKNFQLYPIWSIGYIIIVGLNGSIILIPKVSSIPIRLFFIVTDPSKDKGPARFGSPDWQATLERKTFHFEVSYCAVNIICDKGIFTIKFYLNLFWVLKLSFIQLNSISLLLFW